MDNIIENARNGKYDGNPKQYTVLYDDLVKAGLQHSILRFQESLHQGKLVEECYKYLDDKEANRP